MPTIYWRAIAWGLYYLFGMVILLKLVEGMVFSSLPYDSRGVGRFLSPREFSVQGYSITMLVGYLLVHSIKIALPAYFTAKIAGTSRALHATIVVLIATAFNWIVFQPILYAPGSEIIGVLFSITIACVAAFLCELNNPKNR